MSLLNKTLTLLLLLATAAGAQPVIDGTTGTLGHREAFTIISNGNTFGAAGGANGGVPLLWDDFNGGENGDLLPVEEPSKYRAYSGWGGLGSQYSTGQYYGHLSAGGKGQSQMSRYPDVLGASIFDFPATKNTYMSYWLYIDGVFSGVNDCGQYKHPRLNSPDNDYNDTGSTRLGAGLIASINYPDGYGQYLQYDNGDYNDGAVPGPGSEGAGGSQATFTPPIRRWARIEMYKAHSSTPGAADGRLWIKYGESNIADTGYNAITMGAGQGTAMNDHVWMGHAHANADVGNSCDDAVWTNNNWSVYLDNFYVSDTMARVVLGESNVYSDCDKLQNQIISSWTPGIITAEFNAGEFVEDDVRYLYVIDASGAVSAPLEVTLGTTPDPPAPEALGPATGLTAVKAGS